ncbi:MAG TPA: EAL domain-containing protein [Hyphomicrobiaceae bacterium]
MSEDDAEPAGVEGDVEVIQDMIRMFSEEIAHPRKPSSDEAADERTGSGEPAEADEAAISASVDALRAAAEEMRRPVEGGRASIEKGVLPPLRVDPNSSKPQPPPVGPEHEDMAAMADAIATGKLDVFLEPIVGLADRKARHFEISLRLRNGDAGSFGPEDYIPMARNAGLLPQVDATRAARAAMVARHMDERGSGGCLFSSITAESLTSPRFLEEFADACRQAPKLRERLVFSISQSELQGLSAAQWSTIRQLATSGFRFAIEDVTSLDLDLPDLKAAGFAFMRINAQSMLDGLASLEGVLPISELCQRISEIGLTLIAVGLGGEDQLESVLAAGVPLGQGQLFGVPRPIRAEALRPAASSAAA